MAHGAEESRDLDTQDAPFVDGALPPNSPGLTSR